MGSLLKLKCFEDQSYYLYTFLPVLSSRAQHSYCEARVTFTEEGHFFNNGYNLKGFFLPCYPAALSGVIGRSAVEGPSFVVGVTLCYLKGWTF